MSQTPSRDEHASSDADDNHSPAPITVMLSSRLMVLANLLKRGRSCATSVSQDYRRSSSVWSPRSAGGRR